MTSVAFGRDEMFERKLLADEIESAIQLVMKKRDGSSRVITDNIMAKHRDMIVAALRAAPAALSADQSVGDWELAMHLIQQCSLSEAQAKQIVRNLSQFNITRKERT